MTRKTLLDQLALQAIKEQARKDKQLDQTITSVLMGVGFAGFITAVIFNLMY